MIAESVVVFQGLALIILLYFLSFHWCFLYLLSRVWMLSIWLLLNCTKAAKAMVYCFSPNKSHFMLCVFWKNNCPFFLVKRGRQVVAEHVDVALCCYRLWVVARTCLFPPTFATKVRGGAGCRLNVSRSDNLPGSPRYTFSLQPPLNGAWLKPMQRWVSVLIPNLNFKYINW